MDGAGHVPQAFYHPPIKRSVEIAGHKTSISLEPIFWDLLQGVAREAGLPANALIARIDADRLSVDPVPGLAGAIRTWLANRLIRPDAPFPKPEEQR